MVASLSFRSILLLAALGLVLGTEAANARAAEAPWADDPVAAGAAAAVDAPVADAPAAAVAPVAAAAPVAAETPATVDAPVAAPPAADAPAAADAPPAAEKPLPVALVDALNKLSGGPHKGFRANHAKGIMVEGVFTPDPAAPSFSKAPHFRRRVPILVRFSDPTGVPTLPDADPNASPHGMAIRFKLPDGGYTDIVSLSANAFPVATPEDFLAFLQAAGASGADAPKPTPIEKFLEKHPAAVIFVSTPRPPPVSFATLEFYGVNSFRFVNADGLAHYARYQIAPAAGEHALSPDEAKQADPNYLMDELPARLAKGPVKFQLLAQVADPGDAINDPTVTWPQDRKLVPLGTLSLTTMAKDQVNAQKLIMFSPLNLQAGIEPSEDPVLLARPAAYGVSFSQRIQ
jgi:catalase